MKKLFLSFVAIAAMIFASSCQQEKMEQPAAQENTVTYTVELPAEVTKTKAIGDGLNVDQLIFEVWKTKAPKQRDLKTAGNAIRLYQDQTTLVTRDGVRKAVVTLNLVQDQEYTILFWAQVAPKEGETAVYNTETLIDVHYNQEWLPNKSAYLSNQESYAAFYAADFVSKEIPKAKTVKLKRPFAQLNIATENNVEEYNVEMKQSKVIISNVATRFDVAMNTPEQPAVDGFSKIEFKTADIPNDPATIGVNGQTYNYVAMNYIFANGNADVYYEIDTKLASKETPDNKVDAKVVNDIPSVRFKENYRTNIVGNLLSSKATYTVEIDKNWADAGDGSEVEVWDGKNILEPKKNANGEYEISLATELAWLAAAVNGTIVNDLDGVTKSTGYKPAETFNGKTFVLTADIDLQNAAWIPIGATGTFDGTFDGKGHVIKNLNVNIDDILKNASNFNISDPKKKFTETTSVGLFGRCQGVVKNVCVDGATIAGHYKAAVVVADALCGEVDNCQVKNATVTSTPYNNDDANCVGAIVGFLSADSGKASVKNCAAVDVTVTGYRDVAAIVGTATYAGDNNAAVISGNVVENATIIADQTSEYKESKPANVGTILGRNSNNKAVLENNSVENSSAVVKVNTATTLQYQANNNPGEIEVVFASDIQGDVTVDQQEGHNVIINGDGKKYDGTITIDGNSRNDGAETLLIKNVNFETEDSDVYFVEMNSKESDFRYAHNVTIDKCTFKGNETVVGARFRQCYNITFQNSEVISGHSLAQLYGCTGVTVDNVKVNALGGISFGTSTGVVLTNSNIAATEKYGYAVRIDADGERSASISKSTLKAGVPVLMRYAKAAYELNLSDNNIESTEVYDVIVTAGDYKETTSLTVPTVECKLNGADGYVIYPNEDGIHMAKNADELNAVMASAKAGDVINLLPGTYQMSAYKAGVKLVGSDNASVIVDVQGKAYGVNGDVNIENVTLKYSNANYKGFQHAATSVYTNCIIEGQPFLYGENVTFEGCTFNQTSADAYNVWTYGAKNVTFNECTFNSAGKSVLVYNESGPGSNVTFEKCQLNASAPVEGKAAIEIDSSLLPDGQKHVINVNNTTATGFAAGNVSENTLWNHKKGEKAEVYVNGAQWYNGYYVQEGQYYAATTKGLQSLIANTELAEINLAPATTFEGTFTIQNRNVSIKANNDATIKGRVNIAGATQGNVINFSKVNFDRNDTDSDAAWNTALGSSNCLNYKAVVMIYGNSFNKVNFDECKFFNNLGTHKSAITNSSCELIINKCYFEGRSSAIYTQLYNVSMTDCTINYTGTNNVVLSINGAGNAGGKLIFTGNKSTGDNIYAMGQFLTTVGYGTGVYNFNIQGNEGFDNAFFNTGNVTNKTFAEGSLTF